MVAEDYMGEEVERDDEVRSGSTPPHFNGLCGVSEKQDQGTNHDVLRVRFRCSNHGAIRCDGKQPTCGQCASKKRKCVLSSSVDKRKYGMATHIAYAMLGMC